MTIQLVLQYPYICSFNGSSVHFPLNVNGDSRSVCTYMITNVAFVYGWRFLFAMSGPSTGESQAPHFLLVFAQPAGVQRAVSLFVIQLGPLEESGAYGGDPQWKNLWSWLQGRPNETQKYISKGIRVTLLYGIRTREYATNVIAFFLLPGLSSAGLPSTLINH